MTGHKADNPILVTPEDLLPTINRYFEKLSELQWSLIEDGTLDSDAQGLLADMISEIIQIAATRILRLALPQSQSQTLRGESPEEIREKIKPSLGDSVSASIASALNVVKQTCESAQKLTKMIEREVADKITLVVSLITESPSLPSDPAIYVSGRMRNIKKLRRMLSHVVLCLRRYVGQLKQCCVRRGDDSSPSHSSDESNTSIIEAESATHKVCSILTRWHGDADVTEEHAKDDEEDEEREETQDFTESEAKAENIPAPVPAEKAAEDIVKIMLDNQDPDSAESSMVPSSPITDFNWRLIINKLRDFYTSYSPSTDSTKQNAYKPLFHMFAKKQFAKLRKEQKEAIKTNKKYFVFLVSTPKPLQDERQASPESFDFSLPRSMPGSPYPEASTSSRASSREPPTLENAVKASSPVSFDTIKSDVNKLYNKLTKDGSNILENIKNSAEIRDFTRELTTKVFDLVMVNNHYKIPVPVMGRSLSDSVISRTPHAVSDSVRPFPSEVLYVLIEDLVEKFVQKVVLWLENEALEQTIKNDKVSGAIADIQKFIAAAQTPTQQKEKESDASEQSGRGSAASSPSRPASTLSTAVQSLFLVKSSPTSSRSVPTLRPECTSLGKRCESEPSKGHIRQPSPSEKSEQGLSQVSTSSYDAERLSKNLSSFLLIRIITKSKKQQLLSSVETNMILDRLKDLVNQEPKESARNLEDSMYRVTKSKRLIEEFGSPGKVLKAAMACDSSFDEAPLRNLKLELGVFPSPPPKKSKVSRFFSAVGKAFLKPFRCCFKGSND